MSRRRWTGLSALSELLEEKLCMDILIVWPEQGSSNVGVIVFAAASSAAEHIMALRVFHWLTPPYG
jgi:hypothetical protein